MFEQTLINRYSLRSLRGTRNRRLQTKPTRSSVKNSTAPSMKAPPIKVPEASAPAPSAEAITMQGSVTFISSLLSRSLVWLSR